MYWIMQERAIQPNGITAHVRLGQFCIESIGLTYAYHLSSFKVDEPGKGTGTAALKLIRQRAREEGVKRLRLRVEMNNERAIRFYLRNGFRFLGGDEEMPDRQMMCVLPTTDDGLYRIDSAEDGTGAITSHRFVTLVGAAKFIINHWVGDDHREGDQVFRSDYFRHTLVGFTLSDIGGVKLQQKYGLVVGEFRFDQQIEGDAKGLCQHEACEVRAEVEDNRGNRYCRACLVRHRPAGHYYSEQAEVDRAIRFGSLLDLTQKSVAG